MLSDYLGNLLFLDVRNELSVIHYKQSLNHSLTLIALIAIKVN